MSNHKMPVASNETYKIQDNHMVLVIFWLCWLVYFVTYVGRLNYSSAIPAMVEQGLLSKAQAGSVSTLFFFAYGGGQLINGILADRFPPRWMIFTGLSLSALANGMISLAPSYLPVLLFWGINGYAQSMIWPPIVHVFSKYLPAASMVRCAVHISSSMAAGTVASYLLSAGVLYVSDWKGVFFVPSILLLTVNSIWMLVFPRIERYAQNHGLPDKEEEAAEQTSSLRPLQWRSAILWLAIPVMAHGVLKDGLTSWIPTLISESMQIQPELSILITAILPVMNLAGAYLASYLNRAWLKREERTASFFFILATAALLLVVWFSESSLVLLVSMLSVISISMLAVNTLFINLIPLRYRSCGKVSTISGLFNSLSYVGAALSTYLVGWLVDQSGWQAASVCWLGIAVIGLIVCIYIVKTKK